MHLENKYYLLTGATGFLGSNLLKSLFKTNSNIIILKRATSNISRIKDIIKNLIVFDIDKDGIKKAFDNYDIETIIHCASNYGRGEVDPLKIVEANLLLPLKLFEYGVKNNLKNFINTDTTLDKGINQYSLSKKQFKEWLELYAKGSKIRCLNIALEHFYGPNDDKTKFISFIINKILNNEDKIDLTEGRQKRDFIYVEDVVCAFLYIIKNLNKLSYGFFNYEIGSNNAFELRYVVELIKQLAGNNKTILNFGVLPYRDNEVMESKSDTRLIKELGWMPKFSLEDGLKKTIEFERGII